MMAHNVRGGCWRYGSRGWTFPPILRYMLLLHDRWQQRGSLSKWCLTWKYHWRKSMSLNSSMRKKWHPLTFINISWTFAENNQWMWAQWGSGWCVSAVATAVNLHWCRCLWVQHADCCSSLEKKCIVNDDDCVEEQCFVTEIFLYQTVLLCSLYLL